ncbi:MAG: protein translocase subunit SecD [Patescibacteria group bacterium]
MQRPIKRYLAIMAALIVAGVIALPQSLTIPLDFISPGRSVEIGSPVLHFTMGGQPQVVRFEFKQGLDIQGGMQIVLEADMSEIADEDRDQALESVREVILRRVDLYGISEPVVRTAITAQAYRLIVELPGVSDPTEALALVGQTAQLEFNLFRTAEVTAEQSMSFEATGLTGAQLQRSSVQFDPNTGQPVVGIEFDDEGSQLFADITTENSGEMLAIFLDGDIIMAPQINEPIYGGQAVISGDFGVEEAKQLSIQLNAGALPVPIQVVEQRTIGATLGQEAVRQSIFAGLVGLGCVMLFMLLVYRMAGVLACIALLIYLLLTIAVYKIMGVTLTVPGIAGLLLTIGMALDATILIFERIKEEVRLGKPFAVAMELGFNKAWNSIRDANIVSIVTALVLINPFNLAILNTSGMVRGFGMTLLIGVLLALLTGVVIMRTLVRLFMSQPKEWTRGYV